MMGCLQDMLVQPGAKIRQKEAHLGHENQYANKAEATRDVGEPEPEPPGKQLNDVAIDEDTPTVTSKLVLIIVLVLRHACTWNLTVSRRRFDTSSTCTNGNRVREHCKKLCQLVWDKPLWVRQTYKYSCSIMFATRLERNINIVGRCTARQSEYEPSECGRSEPLKYTRDAD